MSKFIPEIKFENAIKSVFGSQWKSLHPEERDGAFGIAVVKSISDGVESSVEAVANYLGVDRSHLYEPFNNLYMNGIFQNKKKIKEDRLLRANDLVTLCYYAGYATASTGPYKKRGDNWK